MDPAHYYSGYKLDYSEKTFELLLNSKTDSNLMSVWEEEFKSFTNVNVCLSGGIDSQFVVYVLTKLCKNIKIYIFSLIWDDCVFNSPDVLHAIRFCKRHNLEYTNIEIDYKKFSSNTEILETCKKYKTDSPQIALHLKMLDFIDNSNPIFLGSDTPLMQYDFDTKKGTVSGLSYQFYTTNAFLNYSIINNKLVIKDIFKMTPTTQYLSYKHFIETTKKHKLVLPAIPSTSTVLSPQQIKLNQYNELGAESFIMNPLVKNTGFEILKIHLAKHSGIFNQFDLLYRFPLETLLKLEEWYHIDFKVIIRHPAMKGFISQYEDFCNNTTDLKKAELYNFLL